MTQHVKMTRVVNTTATSFGFGRKVLIRPGVNEIDSAAWNAVAGETFVAPFLKSGDLVVEGEIEFETAAELPEELPEELPSEAETSPPAPARRRGRPRKA